jgi:hypothetical protein
LQIEYKKIVKVDELAQLIPFRAGATFSQLWQVFYYTRLFKYMHRKYYPQIKTAFNKICTDKNLKILCDLGYFKNPQKDIYRATNKVLPILKEAGFPVNVLPDEPVGNGDINELNNTESFIKLIKLPYFYTLLYPNFRYLIPDALMVQNNVEMKKYKLTFIEIESKKPDWENYIKLKQENYFRLSKDFLVYKKWCEYCELLKIEKPQLNDFKFSVLFICDRQLDLGKGFRFEKI